MSKELQDFVFVSKYARLKDGAKETFSESVDRIMAMHRQFLMVRYSLPQETIDPILDEIRESYYKQEILGAQRALQWGGDQLLYKHARMYNCASTYIDRVEFFPQLMFLLLAGAGVGYSAQKCHVSKLPIVQGVADSKEEFMIPDSIEGWGDSIDVLFSAYFNGSPEPIFNDSLVRSKGSMISGGFKAPGPEPLMLALGKCTKILKSAINRQLTPVEASDLSCIIADAVISGGVRRAALLALFSIDDSEFINYKTGNWFHEHPYRARANVSAVILPTTSYDDYSKIFHAAKEFGEPGIAFLNDENEAYNPCYEVGMFPQINGESGFSFCNLTEIVGKKVSTPEDFYRACRVASMLGTIQATYTDFPYLGKATEAIVKRDALIGVGITGMAECPDIIFDDEVQRKGAEIVKETNIWMADILGINPAARTTVIKPSGNSAAMVGTSSGIHPFHAKRYIRNVQVNKSEQAGQVIQEVNPRQVRESIYNSNDYVLSFPVELDGNIITRHDENATEFLERVKLTQNNWIKHGINTEHPASKENPKLTHNVSNTCTVNQGEWEEVKEYLWDNRESFCGVSLLPASGDLDYPQAPFTEVLNSVELAEEYGDASILAGGLNTDANHIFGDLWLAISTALGKGEDLEFSLKTILDTIRDNTEATDSGFEFVYHIEGVRVDSINAMIAQQAESLNKKKDWVRRFNKFAEKHLGNDLDRTGRCLKQVSIFHQWTQLQQISPVDWNSVIWEETFKESGSDVASACSGGKCEIIQ